ncbi:MAG: amidohydrolase family protein [Acidobacteria bacterium]|nr:amidohydrolase family protein [Acidobacteriota bacterium]
MDGTGGPARAADVLVALDVIEEVAPPGSIPDSAADGVVDASGKIVAPGFIDLHSHGDLILALDDEPLRRRLVHGRLAQGITTEVVGNCGLGAAPVAHAHERELRDVVAWMTPKDEAWRWRTVGEYLDRLEALGVPLNVATLVAHGALRVEEAGLARPLPWGESIAAIAASLDRALGDGAFGMSLGLIYPPGSFTPSTEIDPLARVLARRDALLTAHVRGSSETLLDAVEEILSYGRGAGVRVHHSHSEAVGPAHWAMIPRVLEMEGEARRAGVRVTYDMFPYTAAATSMAAIYPPWALAGGLGALVDRLRDPATRARVRRDVESLVPAWPPWGVNGWAHNLVLAVGWRRITVGTVATEGSRWAEGLSLTDLAERAGSDPFDAISDLMVAAEGRVSQIIHGISGDEADDSGLMSLLADPHSAFCTDANDVGRGLPHPAAYGTFPKILGEFVRGRGVLPIEEAIRKMTSYPAAILGLADRGVVRRGARADLVVFDAATIGSAATFAEPRRMADGIDLVIVNGETAVERGELRSMDAGKVLRR